VADLIEIADVSGDVARVHDPWAKRRTFASSAGDARRDPVGTPRTPALADRFPGRPNACVVVRRPVSAHDL